MTIGIDLGTTNTVAAIDGEVLELSDASKRRSIMPSAVAFPPTGATLVGTAARRRRAIDPRNTIFSSKRIIGRTWFSMETGHFQKRYPFELIKTNSETPAFRTRAGVFSPTEIATKILGPVAALCANAATSKTLIGVPASFPTDARLATAEAARKAGFMKVEVVDEPLATAWAYFINGLGGGTRYAAVYDLGGGTFDLAIVDCTRQPFKVLAHGGDVYLGGDDVDHALATWAAEEVLRVHRWDLRTDAEVFDRLMLECEYAKIRLSYAAQTRIELSQVDPLGPAGSTGLSVDRPMLARLCTDLAQRTFTVCDQVLAKVGLKAAEIGSVFLAGGSTLLPMVRSGVEAYFGRPARCDFDPMEVVSIGASHVK
jgi:molecular chaperone DnaK